MIPNTIRWKDEENGILEPDFLSKDAEDAAVKIHGEQTKTTNKVTQIRKFFDEIINYKTQYLAASDKSIFFKQKLPYIKMINAKIAYSNARDGKLIGDECKNFFITLINQINDEKDFLAFADFFEAFIAYYKQYEKSTGNKGGNNQYHNNDNRNGR